MKTIAIIDDDIHIGDMLTEVLTQEGYAVLRAYSGTEALYLLSQNKPDLVLLDLMLPGLSGEEVLPHIENIPVIVLSAKVDVQDKVNLLLSGAVDYMTKPFDTKELLARITVQLRKAEQHEEIKSLSIGDLVLDMLSLSLMVQGQAVKLTRTEYAILKLLMENPKQVIAKSVLLDRISLDTPDCTERSLKQHISNLRKKMQDISGVILTLGVGFGKNFLKFLCSNCFNIFSLQIHSFSKAVLKQIIRLGRFVFSFCISTKLQQTFTQARLQITNQRQKSSFILKHILVSVAYHFIGCCASSDIF